VEGSDDEWIWMVLKVNFLGWLSCFLGLDCVVNAMDIEGLPDQF
jgi:hypothetical protein